MTSTSWRGWRNGLAALCGLVALISGCGGSDNATLPAQAEDVASSSTTAASTSSTAAIDDDAGGIAAAEKIGLEFMDARADYNSESLVSLMAPNVTFGGSELAQTVQDYPLQTEWERAVGWQFHNVLCQAGSPDRVVCRYSVQNKFNQQAGKSPFTGTSFLLEIDDDRLVRVTHNVTPEEDYFAEPEVNFLAWVREIHPGDIALMVGDRPLGIVPVRLTPESIQLWTEHTTEYLATTAPAAGEAKAVGDALENINAAVGLPSPTIEGYDYLSADPVSWGADGPAAVLFAPLADFCPHCSVHLDQLTDYLAGNDGTQEAQVLLVTSDEQPSAQHPQDEWLTSRGWPYATVLASPDLVNAFGLTSVPVWILVGSDGTVTEVIDGHHATPAEVFTRINALE